MRRIAFIMIILLFFAGCINNFEKIIIDDNLHKNSERDPFTINKIQQIRDIISFNISYGGGCEEHIFKLISTSFMESYPVQVNIVLSHEDNDDPCDMWITQMLNFNLIPLKESYFDLYNEKSGIILLNIEGWNEPIEYKL
jgi:hypothetical protein